ncbi:MAG: glycerophosphoryl diester phosphodiesterase membrane domain-containing protein [Novosphingobium sp.]
MKFDSNQAWQAALAAVSAKRSVLWPVAGVFFLLPNLISVWFLSDVQAAMMANMGNPAGAEAMMQGMMGKVAGLGLLTFVVQTTGYMALMALLTDRERPTVGQAITTAVKSLPSLIGAAIVAYIGLIALAVLMVSIVAGIYSATTSAGAAWMLGMAALAVFAWVLTKLSLTLPVIVVDGVLNPVAALRRSWRLVSGNSLRVFVFYVLLAIGYAVISMVFLIVLGALFGLGQMTGGLPKAGTGAMVALGLVSGLIGTAVSVLFTAIVAAIHRQLAGPSPDTYGETFA